MTELMRRAASVLPRQRRWRRILRSLRLDPDALERPLEAPGPRDFMICGCPRTGTALLTAMLYQPPRCVTVMEPWDAMRMPPADLFRSLRAEMADGHLGRGRLDLDALRDHGTVAWCSDGAQRTPIEVDERTAVGVKFPAFWRYLDLLPTTRFLVCVREPAATVASFAKAGGRLRAGLDYDIPFNRSMNESLLARHPGPEERRWALYDHINAKVLEHADRPEVHLVRYERWSTDPAQQLAEVGAFLGIPLEDRAGLVRPSPERAAGGAPTPSRTAARLGYR